ncbi:MAG: S41 family peptidase [Flavobacteriia bacterium]|nr:S41 family peptidase [Flavobacteriia bacterium]NBV91396.1 S41 family peptidase [Flavobacteriia bacterium]
MRKQMKWSLLLAILFFFQTNWAQSEAFEELKSLEILDQIYENLDLYFVDEIQHGKLSKIAIDAMLNELDPYTVYYHEANIEDYKLMTTGQYGGVGALIGTINGFAYITDPYEGNPAQKAGLKAGDKILTIDKRDMQGKSMEAVSDAMKGPKGTAVNIEIERQGTRLSFNVTRDEIKIPDVPYSGMLKDKIGYIALSSFTQTASEEIKKNLLELQGKGMEGLILDLRGNGGGLLIEAVKIVNFFVPKGQVVVSTKGRAKQENMVYTTLSDPLAEKLPLVVLVDEGSASASEIVAGSLQDLDRAVVIGATSYGKGLVQRTFDLKYGSKIKLTIAKYYTPSGRCVQRLEYYDNVNENHSKEIPDSLLQKFKTKNGREVIDGRGIEPDVKIEDSLFSDITRALLTQNKIFLFANDYVAKNETLSSPESYVFTEKDMKDFIGFLEKSNFMYESTSEKYMSKLKAELEQKNQFAMVEPAFLELQKKLKIPFQDFILAHTEEIGNLMENEIIGRYYYQKGKNIHAFRKDPVTKSAIDLLQNLEQYKKTLNIK